MFARGGTCVIASRTAAAISRSPLRLFCFLIALILFRLCCVEYLTDSLRLIPRGVVPFDGPVVQAKRLEILDGADDLPLFVGPLEFHHLVAAFCFPDVQGAG